MKRCDHTSVGMLVWKNDGLLLIERARPPYGFAPPAGHVDGAPSYEAAAEKELSEEVGLTAEHLTLSIEGRKDNPCRREDGNWHNWKVYTATVRGDITRSKDETKQARFVDKTELASLARKTEAYRQGALSDAEWQHSPGLEQIWYEWFQDLGIIERTST